MNVNEPKLSVIIASKVGPPFIIDCLASLANQKNGPDFEVIVVDCHGKETQQKIQTKYPWVKLIAQEGRHTIPDLRRVGVQKARGEIIAILEEHCLASEEWVATIVKNHESPYVVVGGSVADWNYDRLRDWVTYFCEYNAYMPPVPEGTVNDLPGNNISFKQNILRRHLQDLDHGYWEAFLYSRLQSENTTLFSDPKMVVYHRGPFNYLYYLRQRYLFSRAYAGARRTLISMKQRLFYLLASPILPALLLSRIAARVWQKRCHIDKFILCLPMLIPVTFVYIFGEFVGYLVGQGDSLLKVE